MSKGDHLFKGVKKHDTFYLYWTCSCGAKGRPSAGSEGGQAFDWYRHAFRFMGVTIPRSGEYQPWMRQSTEASHGLRAADLQRAYLDLHEVPNEKEYPWGRKELND